MLYVFKQKIRETLNVFQDAREDKKYYLSSITKFKRKKKKKTLSSSQCQHTQDENAMLPLQERDVVVACI